MKTCFLSIFLFFVCQHSFCQNSARLDSLLTVLKGSEQKDSTTAKTLKAIGDEYLNSDPQKSIEYFEKALDISKKINFKKHHYYYALASAQDANTNFEQSIKNYFLAIEEAQLLTSPSKEDYMDRDYGGLASVYSKMENYELAKKYGMKALEWGELINDNGFSSAIANFNLGNFFLNSGDNDKALQQYKKASQLFEQSGQYMYMGNVYNSIGSVYDNSKQHAEAIKEYEKALSYVLKYNPADLNSQAMIKNNIGMSYKELGKYDLSLNHILDASKDLEKTNNAFMLITIYENIGVVYEKLGDYKNSNLYFRMYVGLKDSLFTDDSKRTIHEMAVKYESEKKEKENIILTSQNQKRQITIYFISGGLILVIGILFLIFRNSRQKTKANELLAEKNRIIEEKSAIVTEQNKDIKDSIKYAQRIQSAILPPDQVWNKIIPDSFLLYLPKDILSGDFYWVEETEDFIFVAAADCTGHGVPGALVSVVNYNLLNKAVLEKNHTKPSEILDSVNLWLTDSLHQSYQESAVKDGMDISLLSINKKTKEVLYAGANNPIYIVGNGKLREYKADKFPVGAFIEEQQQFFTTKKPEVNPGDCIYLFSDGFADQFGGEKGKKYKYKQLQEKLISISGNPMAEQKELLLKEFISWKGMNEQIDDVCVIGIRM